MAAILPIIAQLIPLIASLTPLIANGVESLIAFIASVRTAAQQSGEWTPELEKAFLDALLARFTSPAWRPDPK